MKKLVIIPEYNEGDCIRQTIDNILEYADGYDYIVVNDCSRDKSAEILKAGDDPCLNLPVNLGIGGAVQTGYRFALEHGYTLAVQIDGDGQHDARYLAKMEKALFEQDAAMVIGSRFIDNDGFQSTKLRRVGISYFSRLIRLVTGCLLTDPTSGMRMVGQEGIKLFAKNYPRDYPEAESLVYMLRKGKKVVEVPVVMQERQGGVSSIRRTGAIYYMIKVTLAILIERIR